MKSMMRALLGGALFLGLVACDDDDGDEGASSGRADPLPDHAAAVEAGGFVADSDDLSAPATVWDLPAASDHWYRVTTNSSYSWDGDDMTEEQIEYVHQVVTAGVAAGTTEAISDTLQTVITSYHYDSWDEEWASDSPVTENMALATNGIIYGMTEGATEWVAQMPARPGAGASWSVAPEDHGLSGEGITTSGYVNYTVASLDATAPVTGHTGCIRLDLVLDVTGVDDSAGVTQTMDSTGSQYYIPGVGMVYARMTSVYTAVDENDGNSVTVTATVETELLDEMPTEPGIPKPSADMPVPTGIN